MISYYFHQLMSGNHGAYCYSGAYCRGAYCLVDPGLGNLCGAQGCPFRNAESEARGKNGLCLLRRPGPIACKLLDDFIDPTVLALRRLR